MILLSGSSNVSSMIVQKITRNENNQISYGFNPLRAKDLGAYTLKVQSSFNQFLFYFQIYYFF